MTRVLIVEDEEDIRMMLRATLRRCGYELIEAVDGRAGVDTFHREAPDLVLLDIGLPELDGWEVLERIRAISTTPVMLISAHGSEADQARGLRNGANDYLTKPFGPRDLVARIQRLLESPARP
jgi:DNA-binding response OmpR family regulator